MASKKTSKAATKSGISVKSRVKAGNGNGNRIISNHNQAAKGLRVKSRVRAGGGTNGTINVGNGSRIVSNHNQAAKGLRVKSRVKAGLNFAAIKL